MCVCYIKFSSGYQLIIINVSIPNPSPIDFLNFDLQRLPLLYISKFSSYKKGYFKLIEFVYHLLAQLFRK